MVMTNRDGWEGVYKIVPNLNSEFISRLPVLVLGWVHKLDRDVSDLDTSIR
jgi:hypothetical protein